MKLIALKRLGSRGIRPGDTFTETSRTRARTLVKLKLARHVPETDASGEAAPEATPEARTSGPAPSE